MKNLSVDEVIVQAYKNYHSKLASMEESLKLMRLWTYETAKHVDKCSIQTHVTSEYVMDIVKEKGDELSSLIGPCSHLEMSAGVAPSFALAEEVLCQEA